MKTRLMIILLLCTTVLALSTIACNESGNDNAAPWGMAQTK